MSELDPRSLWQEQPLDSIPVEPERASKRPLPDFASATTSFGVARWPVRVFAATLAIAAAVALFAAFSSRPSVSEIPSRTPPGVADLFAECRTWADPASGEPDWNRATRACERVLEVEPSHPEAQAQLARIKVLRSCEEDFLQAGARAADKQGPQALTLYERLTRDCETYFVRAQAPARKLAFEVRTEMVKECRRYSEAKQWASALPACELAAHVGCQFDDVSDVKFLLAARVQLKLREAPWKCDEVAVLQPLAPPPDPAALAVDELSKREFGGALVLYFKGDFSRSTAAVEEVLQDPARRADHELARALLKALTEAIGLYERSIEALDKGDLEDAASLARRALAVDERLILGGSASAMGGPQRQRALEDRLSFLRKSIRESISAAAYEHGKALADQKDFRGACRDWKLGSSFSRRSIDLLKGMTNVCTPRAREALERAPSCAQLAAAREFAVDGDGLVEEIDAVARAQGCAPF